MNNGTNPAALEISIVPYLNFGFEATARRGGVLVSRACGSTEANAKRRLMSDLKMLREV